MVLACLGAAGVLFWLDARDDGEPRTRTAPVEERELAEGELQVPDDDVDDDRRRGAPGRNRLEQGRGGSDDAIDNPADADDDDDEALPGADSSTPLPAVFRHLEGRDVVLLPASMGARGNARALVSVGGLRVPCAAATDPARLARELDLATALRTVLERAGARVTSLGPEAGCVDTRVRRLERGELALVVRAVASGGRVLAGRPAAGMDAAARRPSETLAAELAAALSLQAPRAPDAAARTLLARTAAIDLPGGAAVALVELAAGAGATSDSLAFSIARGLAVTASRVNGGSAATTQPAS